MPVTEGASDFRGVDEVTAIGRADAINQNVAANPSATVSANELGEILHGLNNVLVSIVLNAQIMEWKLPSYSLMRRNTHEIQRSARRAGVLLKRLSARTIAPNTSPDNALESS